METINLCNDCEKALKEWGAMPYLLAIKVIREYSKGGECRIHLDGSPESSRTLQIALFLEQKGIFVTTENGLNEIKMKPIGRYKDDIFCCYLKPKYIDENLE